jgi:soluble P-type ATPase
MLASAQQVLAIFAVADTIKESSREAVADLHRLGVVSVMLTGDNVATAASIAKEAGIDDARGNLLPEDKLAAIEDLQRRYGPTAMTGDGINDAPALARADIGVAMGAAGTDTAMEAADVVIMNDDLRRIPETIRLSRRTHAVLWQNIGLALGIKAIFLGLAVFGNATMWMAVFADMGASLLVVGNGVRCGGLPAKTFADTIPPMRRWLSILLLVFLPFQFSWAAVAGYCQHETGAAITHSTSAIMTTSIRLRDADQDGTPDAKTLGGGIDGDCVACHASCAAAIFSMASLPASSSASFVIPWLPGNLTTPPLAHPERPNWSVLA